MLFAGLAASAAIDLLSLLQPEKAQAKGGTSLSAQPTFALPEQGPVEAAQTQSLPAAAAPRTENLSRDALDTLLSAQGQEAARRKKRSTSVLLDLLQSSQKGSVSKSEFDAAAGESGEKESGLFDRIDQDRDGSINTAEMSLYLNTHKRNADAKTAARTFAMVA
jgi:hypothetical protein